MVEEKEGIGEERRTKNDQRRKEGRKERVRDGREIVRAVHCSFLLLLLFVDTLALERGNHADAKTGWFLGCCVFLFCALGGWSMCFLREGSVE